MEFSLQKVILKIFVTCFLALPQLFWHTGHTANAEILKSTKPNIIFIMADDLGKVLLPMYGAKPTIKMPNLEQLAKEGVVFKNSYATPFCFSTRVELVSGRYSLNTGAYQNQFPDAGKNSSRVVRGGRTTGFYKYFYNGDSRINPFIDPQYTPSFAMPLKQAGYTTAVIGKWHLNHYHKQQRIFRTYGFDRWMMYGTHNSSGAVTDKGFVTAPGYIPAKAADFIIDFITENKNKPFFIYFPMNLVHSPFLVPLNPFGRFTHTEPERHIAMIEYVDVIIGRIAMALKQLGLKDRTIIFFSGDNGAPIQHRRLYELLQDDEDDKTKPFHAKGTLYEGGINVPLIVSGGPVVQRGETEALIDFTDIFPTLADLAGISVVRKEVTSDSNYRGVAGLYTVVAKQYKVDGHSVAPFLTGHTDDTPRDWIMFPRKDVSNTVIRDKRFKLWDEKNRLYDLYNDPYEQINLYDSNEANTLVAKKKLEGIIDKMPIGSNIDTHFDPVSWDYGMLTHWTMDSGLLENMKRLTDTESGYDAESDTNIVLTKQGKFGNAIIANSLHVPYSQGLFYNFIIDDNQRTFRFFSDGNIFIRALGKLIRTNQISMNITDNIYNAWSNRDDRTKFLSSMTISAWLQTSQPNQNIYLLRQPYITKDSDLINFSITADATLSFELVTNGKHHKLESRTIDEKLWRQWMHVAVTWDGRDSCGKTILYVNSEAVAQSCLGKPLSAEGTDDLLLGGLVQKTTTDNSETLIDDIAIWRQPLMPTQIDALYSLGNRFSYNASEVDALFNTPEKDGVTKIRDHRWQRTTLEHTSQNERLIIKELPNATKIQFGKVMAIRCLACRPQI